ncbi:CTP--molybdopterin cytidylyltransferase, partial [Salmonella enterica subsp. enterica serovar Cerro]
MVSERPAQKVAALMLAAGYSRRFGADKRRLQLGDGRSLLSASLA